MLSDGAMILIILAALIAVPTVTVFTVLAVNRSVRNRKNAVYTGETKGTVSKIVDKGLDFPWVIHVKYCVDGINYEIKETAKLKSSPVKAFGIPIGQKKTFVLGSVQAGDTVTVRYDKNNPQKAVIYGNDGIMTG